MKARRQRSQPKQTTFDPKLIIYATANKIIHDCFSKNNLSGSAFHLVVKTDLSRLTLTIRVVETYAAMILRMQEMLLKQEIKTELEKMNLTFEPELKILIQPSFARPEEDSPTPPTV